MSRCLLPGFASSLKSARSNLAQVLLSNRPLQVRQSSQHRSARNFLVETRVGWTSAGYSLLFSVTPPVTMLHGAPSSSQCLLASSLSSLGVHIAGIKFHGATLHSRQEIQPISSRRIQMDRDQQSSSFWILRCGHHHQHISYTKSS